MSHRTALLLLGLFLAAPGAPQDVFSDEERVTAVDVVVAFDHHPLRKWGTGRAVPRNLQPGDFEVLCGGEKRPVVAVETEGEPWTIVLYFDQVLTSPAGVAWAADVLTRHAEDLTRLGDVEVVVADPVPRPELAVTRDSGALHGVLSQMALRLSRYSSSDPEGSGQELLDMRTEFLAEVSSPTPAVDPQELARWVVGEEVRIGRLWQDRLLDFLVGRAGVRSRRALVLVSSGYDLSPGEFYLPAVGLAKEAHAESTADLHADLESLSRTLAAYGWIVVALRPPPPEPVIRPGKRIGKWRIYPSPVGLGATREAERDVKKAEAYLELGTALRKQGKLEDAGDALEKALHHFYGDPRTASRQAVALLELGAVLAELGEDEEAQRAFTRARVLAPGLARESLGRAAEMLDAVAPLAALAQATAGGVVKDAKDFARAVVSLESRVRLTYQVAGLATGRLCPVAVSSTRDGPEVQAPGWARSATPETVATARVRRMLAGDSTDGELGIDVSEAATLPPGPPGGAAGEVTVKLLPSSHDSGGELLMRVTVAAGAPDVLARVWHGSPEILSPDAVSEWSHRHRIELTPGDSLVAVHVEDLYSGSWGTALVAVKDPDRDD